MSVCQMITEWKMMHFSEKHLIKAGKSMARSLRA